MSSKVNIVLDDDVKSELENLVENGLRSRVINNAVAINRSGKMVTADDMYFRETCSPNGPPLSCEPKYGF